MPEIQWKNRHDSVTGWIMGVQVFKCFYTDSDSGFIGGLYVTEKLVASVVGDHHYEEDWSEEKMKEKANELMRTFINFLA